MKRDRLRQIIFKFIALNGYAILAFIGYAVCFLLFHPVIGESLAMFAVLPVMYISWALGMRRGLIAAVAIDFDILLLFSVVGKKVWDVESLLFRLPVLFAIILIAVFVGYMHELKRRLQQQLAEKVKTEQALIESEKSFRQMFENTSEGVALIDPENGRFLAANPAVCELFGYTEDEFCTITPEDLTPPEAKEIMRNAMKLLFAGGNVSDHEGISLKKDGTRINVIVSNRQLMWKGKQVFHTTFKNITFLKDIQRQLEKKSKEIIDFTTVTAHDLKKPLSTVKTACAMLKEIMNRENIEIGADFSHQGLESIVYMESLIDDLLTAVKFEFSGIRCEPENIVCKELVDAVVSRLALQIKEKNVMLTMHVPQTVYADKKHLEKILMNLIGNAIAYNRENAIPQISIEGVSTGATVELVIRDNGRGIPVKEQKNIFDKFKRGSNVSDTTGTGLGLFIVRSAVVANGGSITVSSEEGMGTEFRFVLPAGK